MPSLIKSTNFLHQKMPNLTHENSLMCKGREFSQLKREGVKAITKFSVFKPSC
jgi:hypothetical protein